MSLCKRVHTVINPDELMSTESRHPDESMLRNDADGRVFYIEHYFLEESSRAQHSLADTLSINLPKHSDGSDSGSNNGHEGPSAAEKSYETLRSLIDWVNGWTPNTDSNMHFHHIKCHFEKLVPET